MDTAASLSQPCFTVYNLDVNHNGRCFINGSNGFDSWAGDGDRCLPEKEKVGMRGAGKSSDYGLFIVSSHLCDGRCFLTQSVDDETKAQRGQEMGRGGTRIPLS